MNNNIKKSEKTIKQKGTKAKLRQLKMLLFKVLYPTNMTSSPPSFHPYICLSCVSALFLYHHGKSV